MIRYDLKCEHGHGFDAWFASSAAFDEQAERGLVTCAVCGSAKVVKALMAPQVPAKSNRKEEARPMLSAGPASELEKKLAELRAHIEKNSDFVGDRFAEEARAMHVGEKEYRAIHGRATREEARELLEEGVPVAPLPFLPRRDG